MKDTTPASATPIAAIRNASVTPDQRDRSQRECADRRTDHERGGTEQVHAPTADAILGGERAVLSSGFAKARVLRFGGLYGPGRHHLVDQLRRGENVIGGRVDHYINYLHRDDAASSVLAALVGGPAGAQARLIGR